MSWAMHDQYCLGVTNQAGFEVILWSKKSQTFMIAIYSTTALYDCTIYRQPKKYNFTIIRTK